MRKSGHHVSIQWLELCEALMNVRTPFELMVNEIGTYRWQGAGLNIFGTGSKLQAYIPVWL